MQTKDWPRFDQVDYHSLTHSLHAVKPLNLKQSHTTKQTTQKMNIYDKKQRKATQRQKNALTSSGPHPLRLASHMVATAPARALDLLLW
jgi:hypothetical protein